VNIFHIIIICVVYSFTFSQLFQRKFYTFPSNFHSSSLLIRLKLAAESTSMFLSYQVCCPVQRKPIKTTFRDFFRVLRIFQAFLARLNDMKIEENRNKSTQKAGKSLNEPRSEQFFIRKSDVALELLTRIYLSSPFSTP
jgi:hypothetical protein